MRGDAVGRLRSYNTVHSRRAAYTGILACRRTFCRLPCSVARWRIFITLAVAIEYQREANALWAGKGKGSN